jgi:hypothetical protein
VLHGLLLLWSIFLNFSELLVYTFFAALIVALVYLLLSKKKRSSIAVCIAVFLTPVLAVIVIIPMFLRPYVEYGDMLSALKACDSCIEDVELYMYPKVGTTFTANERHIDLYDNEELEIKVFLGSENVDAETAAEIGGAVKDVVDTYIREHFNENTDLEKRVYMVLYPVYIPEREIDPYYAVGSRMYYRIWDFENERFEWLLDGNLWEYYPNARTNAYPYLLYRASLLCSSYRRAYIGHPQIGS